MTPTQQQGYDDQASGMLNASLAEADTSAGREYRDGVRARKRDEFDEAHGEDAQRMRALYPDETAADEEKLVVQLLDTMAEAKKEISNVMGVPSHVARIDPNDPGGAFSEPEPTAKKPRKAKPVDDAQASLF